MFEVWCEPQAQHGYVLGVDTSEGLGHGDYSCVQVLDLNTGEQAAVWHEHIPPDELADELRGVKQSWFDDVDGVASVGVSESV